MRRHLARSRSEAQRLISEGLVVAAGVPEPKPATLVDPDTPIRLHVPPRYVSRAGEKLEAALKEFRIPVEGKRCLDVGASTGGFTECLLEHGAASVVALDVGRGQLDWSLRNDPRVVVKEGVNVRHVDPDQLGAPFEVIAVDVSFISLRTIAESLVALGSETADYVLLVKPQFEAGRAKVPRGGVVRDPQVHREVMTQVIQGLAAAGLAIRAVMASPRPGAKGNVEYLGWARQGKTPVSVAELEGVLP